MDWYTKNEAMYNHSVMCYDTVIGDRYNVQSINTYNGW